MADIHIKAKEVRVGDNVWGHNIVRSLERKEEENGQFVVYIFNGGSADEWRADGEETVMVTNRGPKSSKKKSQSKNGSRLIKKLSTDSLVRVATLYNEGKTLLEIGKVYGVSGSTIYNVLVMLEKKGAVLRQGKFKKVDFKEVVKKINASAIK